MKKEDMEALEAQVLKAIDSLEHVEKLLQDLDLLSGKETVGLPYLSEKLFLEERNCILDIAEELGKELLPELRRYKQE